MARSGKTSTFTPLAKWAKGESRVDRALRQPGGFRRAREYLLIGEDRECDERGTGRAELFQRV